MEQKGNNHVDIELIAKAVVAALAPFTPFLIEVTKEGSKKFAEVLAEKGGESAWNKAQALWTKIDMHLRKDKKIKGAVLMLSADPNDKDTQKHLIKALMARLKEDQHLAKELLDLLGDEGAIQEVRADHKSSISNVSQQISGGGKQTIDADNQGRITGVKQIKK